MLLLSFLVLLLLSLPYLYGSSATAKPFPNLLTFTANSELFYSINRKPDIDYNNQSIIQVRQNFADNIIFSWGLYGSTAGRFEQILDLSICPSSTDVYVMDMCETYFQNSRNNGRNSLNNGDRFNNYIFRIQSFTSKGGKQKSSFFYADQRSATATRAVPKRKHVVTDEELIIEPGANFEAKLNEVILPIKMPKRMKIGLNGIIFILDGYARRIVALALDGTLLYQVGACEGNNGQNSICRKSEQALCDPLDFALSVDNQYIWIIDKRECNGNSNPNSQSELLNYRLMKFYIADGNFVRQRLFRVGYGDGEFGSELGGIAVSSTNYVYISDTQNDRIQIFNSSLHYVDQFGYAGSEFGQLNYPTQLVIAEDLLYVREQTRIQQFPIPKATHN
jgi:hypothetical protein